MHSVYIEVYSFQSSQIAEMIGNGASKRVSSKAYVLNKFPVNSSCWYGASEAVDAEVERFYVLNVTE